MGIEDRPKKPSSRELQDARAEQTPVFQKLKSVCERFGLEAPVPAGGPRGNTFLINGVICRVHLATRLYRHPRSVAATFTHVHAPVITSESREEFLVIAVDINQDDVVEDTTYFIPRQRYIEAGLHTAINVPVGERCEGARTSRLPFDEFKNEKGANFFKRYAELKNQ
ncbi:MAG: hypothetical protein HYS26_02970 [Candidatus Kaiserbacteria bacterium]|nr:MAG: hypothetical protein HYS26_02970 [Candidatus Kaiserbacteria bacterium]